MKSESQFFLCTVWKHSTTNSMASSQWQYPCLLYIVTFVPLWFYQVSRKIVMVVLTHYWRSYRLTNINFLGECLYFLGLLPCNNVYELSTLHILSSSPKLPTSFLDMSQCFSAFPDMVSEGVACINFHFCDVLFEFLIFTFVSLWWTFHILFQGLFWLCCSHSWYLEMPEQLKLCSFLVKVLLLKKQPSKKNPKPPIHTHTHAHKRFSDFQTSFKSFCFICIRFFLKDSMPGAAKYLPMHLPRRPSIPHLLPTAPNNSSSHFQNQ